MSAADASGESAVTNAGSIWWFAERVFQSSKDLIAVGKVPSGDREGRIHPREEDIGGFHFL